MQVPRLCQFRPPLPIQTRSSTAALLSASTIPDNLVLVIANLNSFDSSPHSIPPRRHSRASEPAYRNIPPIQCLHCIAWNHLENPAARLYGHRGPCHSSTATPSTAAPQPAARHRRLAVNYPTKEKGTPSGSIRRHRVHRVREQQNGRPSPQQAHPRLDQGCLGRPPFCRHHPARGAEECERAD